MLRNFFFIVLKCSRYLKYIFKDFCSFMLTFFVFYSAVKIYLSSVSKCWLWRRKMSIKPNEKAFRNGKVLLLENFGIRLEGMQCAFWKICFKWLVSTAQWAIKKFFWRNFNNENSEERWFGISWTLKVFFALFFVFLTLRS